MKKIVTILAIMLTSACSHVEVKFLDDQSTVISLTEGDSILLPIEENAPEIKMDIDGLVWNVRLAQSSVD